MNYDCVFIGVNYFSSKETIQWAKDICSMDGARRCLVILIDNTCGNPDKKLKKELNSINNKIVYIDTNDNLGYLPGANKGVEYLTNNNIEYKYIIVSNVDIRFKTSDMPIKLNSLKLDGIGVVSPSIISDNVDLNPYRINKLTKQQIRNRIIYFKLWFFKPVIDFLRMIKKKTITPTEKKTYDIGTGMYMTYGACFIFTRAYFANNCDINPPIFLYVEEPYVAEMCAKKNLKIEYHPEIVIEDIGRVSTGKIKPFKHNKIMIDAVEYVYKNFYKNLN